jgi:hypothetical protein
MTNTDRSKILRLRLALRMRFWDLYIKLGKDISAKNKDEFDKLAHYAGIIQECQDDLGLDISSFPDIGKSALAFHSLRAAQIVQTNKSNNEYNHNQEQVSEEDYPTDSQYEQERFTDAYSEDFRDDYNKADRFTS